MSIRWANICANCGEISEVFDTEQGWICESCIKDFEDEGLL